MRLIVQVRQPASLQSEASVTVLQARRPDEYNIALRPTAQCAVALILVGPHGICVCAQVLRDASMVQAESEIERLLLVIDESPGSKRAVAYTANILRRRRGFRIHLLHLLPPFPSELLEFGGAEDPRKEQKLGAELRRDQEEWVAAAKASAKPALEEAAKTLRKAGIADRNIDREFSYPTEPRDAARTVLEEASAPPNCDGADCRTCAMRRIRPLLRGTPHVALAC
jgi:signal recognition particle subunit SEC65